MMINLISHYQDLIVSLEVEAETDVVLVLILMVSNNNIPIVIIINHQDVIIVPKMDGTIPPVHLIIIDTHPQEIDVVNHLPIIMMMI